MQLALPQSKNSPSHLNKGFTIIRVPLFCPIDFGLPILSPCLGHPSTSSTTMPMPKTPINKNGALSSYPDNIRLTDDIRAMQPVTRMSKLPQQRPDTKLRAGVFAFNAPHCMTALFVAKIVSQRLFANLDQIHELQRFHYISQSIGRTLFYALLVGINSSDTS